MARAILHGELDALIDQMAETVRLELIAELQARIAAREPAKVPEDIARFRSRIRAALQGCANAELEAICVRLGWPRMNLDLVLDETLRPTRKSLEDLAAIVGVTDAS